MKTKYQLRSSSLFAIALLGASNFAQADEHRNAYGITMVDIPAGHFLMGSCKLTDDLIEMNKKRAYLGQAPLAPECGSPDPEASTDETPQHEVRVQAFQIGKTEVTVGQYKAYLIATGQTNQLNSGFMDFNNQGDDAPVIYISWLDIQKFIAWLNQVDGGGWRLPSEAEWEYACRANQATTYCGSDSLDRVAWYDENSGLSRAPHPVAQKAPNAFGLYDMSGNAWEFVQDAWRIRYLDVPTDGTAVTPEMANDPQRRMTRGGSIQDNARHARAAYRREKSMEVVYVDTGFRLARTLLPSR